MIQVCFYKGCGVVFGEKEPLSDRKVTHGLCPKHLEVYLEEVRAEMGKLREREAGGFKVLIVEDSALFRQWLRKQLKDRFSLIEVHEATDGEEALQMTEALLPDLIFMDIRLPGENGLELTKRIKARHPNMIIIVLTAYDLPEYREFSAEHADFFFSKDSPAKKIFDLVKSILSKCE